MKLLHNHNHPLYLFYFLIFLSLISVLFTEPFLRYPYDAIAHLIAIDEKYHNIAITETGIPERRLIWHSIWANIFIFFHIESSEFLLRAKIIHVTQIYIALFSIYYFSHVVLRNLFINISTIMLKYLSFWSVIIWLSIFGTFSIVYQLVWNLWYSINYQITLPLFFYITALTLVLLLENTSRSKKIFFITQITSISLFILQAHPMEFMYYLMYLTTFFLFYSNMFFTIVKKYYYLVIFPISGLFYFLTNLRTSDSKLLSLIKEEGFFSIYQNIITTGNTVLQHFNRSSHIINELMYIIGYFTIFIALYFLWYRKKKDVFLNQKIFIFVLITSAFIFIPLYQISAGVFGLITKEQVVHRIYYSSSIFILLPIFTYILLRKLRHSLIVTNIFILTLLIFTFYYSKNNPTLNHLYAKNVLSIQNSFLNNYAFHFSQKELNQIENQLRLHERNNPTDKRISYFARADIAFVIKHIYKRKKIYWKDRKSRLNYKEKYMINIAYDKYHNILFRPIYNLPNMSFYK